MLIFILIYLGSNLLITFHFVFMNSDVMQCDFSAKMKTIKLRILEMFTNSRQHISWHLGGSSTPNSGPVLVRMWSTRRLCLFVSQSVFWLKCMRRMKKVRRQTELQSSEQSNHHVCTHRVEFILTISVRNWTNLLSLKFRNLFRF